MKLVSNCPIMMEKYGELKSRYLRKVDTCKLPVEIKLELAKRRYRKDVDEIINIGGDENKIDRINQLAFDVQLAIEMINYLTMKIQVGKNLR